MEYDSPIKSIEEGLSISLWSDHQGILLSGKNLWTEQHVQYAILCKKRGDI